MLTHSINIYKPPAPISQVSTTVYHSPPPDNVPKLSKLDYNKVISELPFKKGDILVSAAIADLALQSITKYAVYKVIDIQEIHYMATYDHLGKPKCLHLKDPDKWDFWSAPTNWRICPQEVLERLGLVEWSKA